MNIVVTEEVSKVIVVNELQPKVVTVNQGLNGQGVPSGGTTGQVLAKLSNSNYDTHWTSNGNGDLLAANNLSDVANTDTARNNLGAITNIESIVNALIFG